MIKQLAILAALGCVTLAACGSKTDANEKNFSAALTQYFDKKGKLCLDQSYGFPVEITEMDMRLQKTVRSGTANQMAALEAAALVKCEVAGRGKRCLPTDAAKPFAREQEAVTWGLDGSQKVTRTGFCGGDKALEKIVKWQGPMKLRDYQLAEITYTYKVDNLADWIKTPEVQTAFPGIKSVLDGAGTRESKHTVWLTREGWEARGLN